MDYKQTIAEIVVQIAGFLIALFALKIFAWKPLLKVLDERRAKIDDSFKDIDRRTADLEKAKQDYVSRISLIEDEARRKIHEAIHEGRRISADIQDKARSDARAITDKAKEDIALEISKARIELKGQIAELAVSASERIMKMEIDEAKAIKITQGVIDEISKMKSKQGKG